MAAAGRRSPHTEQRCIAIAARAKIRRQAMPRHSSYSGNAGRLTCAGAHTAAAAGPPLTQNTARTASILLQHRVHPRAARYTLRTPLCWCLPLRTSRRASHKAVRTCARGTEARRRAVVRAVRARGAYACATTGVRVPTAVSRRALTPPARMHACTFSRLVRRRVHATSSCDAAVDDATNVAARRSADTCDGVRSASWPRWRRTHIIVVLLTTLVAAVFSPDGAHGVAVPPRARAERRSAPRASGCAGPDGRRVWLRRCTGVHIAKHLTSSG
jgi:hypothetical protein